MKTILGILLWIFVICGAQADGPPGHTHTDGSDWIRRGHYTNSLGQACCGEKDCFQIDGKGVSVTPGGYFIKGLRETIPFRETQQSIDGKYWRCAWEGERKCFFAPPPAM